MNDGSAVDPASLPGNVKETDVSLFDGSNCGVTQRPPGLLGADHPEASPGPRDSDYLFRRFVGLMEAAKAGKATTAA